MPTNFPKSCPRCGSRPQAIEHEDLSEERYAASTLTVDRATERILDGALRALARHGSSKLSVSDICREAGISRGTFYRYFADKDAVLLALGDHLHQEFEDNLQRVIDGLTDESDRVRAVLGVITQVGTERPEAMQIIEVEPRFALQFLRDTHPAFLKSLREALRPTLIETELVRSRRMSEMELTELLYRIVLSHYFIPTDSKKLVRQVARLWDSLAQA